MKSVLHPANQRGHVNFGWLDSHHSFSFGHWYEPSRIHFGALRVLNDDVVRGGAGFSTHPHDNMEIVSIPLEGALAHKDSTGTDGVIRTGDVQIMSAGSGITHSEFNASKTDPVNFLQIWVFPEKKNITPRYDQRYFDPADRLNKWQILVSPEEKDQAMRINQDARFLRARLTANNELSLSPSRAGQGLYLFVIDGQVMVGSQELLKKDALGIWETDQVLIRATQDAELLAIEVPMEIR